MRCPRDGRFMRRLSKTGHWWMCSDGCTALLCDKPDIAFGLMLLGFGR